MNRRVALAHLLAVTLLFALHVALFPFATLVTDSGRDLANAWAVGHGGPYPAYGPSLFGTWRLGPAWFWWLAIPLRLSGTLWATALCVGLMAAAKIPLAWLIGRRLLDARFGLLAALLIALPGWSSIGTLVLAHTSVVETAMLATLWLALLAWQTRRTAPMMTACLMLALALHAHPTAVLAAPFLLPPLWRTILRPRRWGSLLLCIAAFVLPFLPALAEEARQGWPQLTATVDYVQQGDPFARAARLPPVLWALLTGGAWLAGRFLLPAPMPTLWWLPCALLLAGAVLGLVRLLIARDTTPAAAGRRLAAVALGVSALAVMCVLLLRDATPAWMVYALSPFGVGLQALGLWGLLQRRTNAHAIVALLALATLTTDVALLSQRIAVGDTGRVLLPGGHVGDIALRRDRPSQPSPWLAAWQFDALAETLCASESPPTLHGDLAAVFDFSQGVAAALHCRGNERPRLGGQAGTHHWAGIPRALALSLALPPTHAQWGHVLLIPKQVLAPIEGRRSDVDVRYRVERQATLAAGGEHRLSGTLPCAAGDILVLTNLMPLVNPWQAAVHQSGQPLQEAAQTLVSRYYRCNGQPLDWEIRTQDPASADIILLGS